MHTHYIHNDVDSDMVQYGKAV